MTMTESGGQNQASWMFRIQIVPPTEQASSPKPPVCRAQYGGQLPRVVERLHQSLAGAVQVLAHQG